MKQLFHKSTQEAAAGLQRKGRENKRAFLKVMNCRELRPSLWWDSQACTRHQHNFRFWFSEKYSNVYCSILSQRVTALVTN